MKAGIVSFFLSCSLLSASLLAQPENEKLDSVLTPDEFLLRVHEHHPVARQARLRIDQREAEILQARGSFDPKAYSKVDQKYFKDENYYWLQESGLQVPTNFGLRAKAGYEQNRGVNLNPENNVPFNGLYFAQLELPLLQGLFIDRRRADLRQAQLLQEASQEEADLLLNKLLQEAMQQYWLWNYYQSQTLLYQSSVETAAQRLEGIQDMAEIGERPLIDTLEATLSLQDRQAKLQEAEGRLLFQRQILETYLWEEGQLPLALEEYVRPDYELPGDLPELEPDSLRRHPKLRLLRLKNRNLKIERQLGREMLKPQLDLQYKFLNEAARGNFWTEYSPNNYSWGFQASFPLFLRKERGKLRVLDYKRQRNELDQSQTLRNLQNELMALRAQYRQTQKQWRTTSEMAENYLKLFQGEQSKFSIGESSVFLLNNREIKYLDSQNKTLKLEQKLQELYVKWLAKAARLRP